MVEQQNPAEHAALGDANDLMDVVHPEGKDAASKRDRREPADRRPTAKRAHAPSDFFPTQLHGFQFPLKRSLDDGPHDKLW